MKYKLLRRNYHLEAGVTLYKCKLTDYGLASQDTRQFGFQCISVTQDPNGGHPCYSVAVHDLEEVK